MKRLEFLVGKGAYVVGTGAVRSAKEVSRPAEIVQYLQACESAESDGSAPQ